METYLHAFDLDNKLKCANLASRRTIDSLFMLDLILKDSKPNPRHISLDLLGSLSPEMMSRYTSTRMLLLHQATILNRLKRVLTSREQSIVKKASIEIEFERVRRTVAPDAPSRLSTLFLAGDNDEGRITLASMLRDVLNNPKVCQIIILNELEMMRADHRWFEQYFVKLEAQYIINYWSQKAAFKNESWEYLLEGSISLVLQNDFEEIISHTKATWPNLNL